MKLQLLVISILKFNGACSVMQKKPALTELQVQPKQTYNLVLSEKTPRRERTRFFSSTQTKTFEKDQLVHEKDEVVDFTVDVTILGKDPTYGGVKQKVVVIDKDGPVDLHEMAFPEVGEELEIIFSKNAKVIRAGAYPRDSIFYVSPVSLPERPVKVGDTWEMAEEWSSQPNGVPLRIELVTIFKSVYQGPKGPLAYLEISGTTKFPSSMPGVRFDSDVRGHLLFAINEGTLVWGYIRNAEKLVTADNQILVESCLVSGLMSPKTEVWSELAHPKCTPHDQPPELPPGV